MKANKWEDTVMGINQWLDRNKIDRAYKKDMKATYAKLKPDFEAQAEATWDIAREEGRKLGREEVVKYLLEDSSGEIGDYPQCVEHPNLPTLIRFVKKYSEWKSKLKEWFKDKPELLKKWG